MSQETLALTFPHGLIGFPDLKEFELFDPEAGPLKFLRSKERPEVSLACMEAGAVKADYQVPLQDYECELLGLTSEEEAMVLVMVRRHEDPSQMTANLAGPLVISTTTLRGLHIPLDSSEFPLQFPLPVSQEEVCIDFPGGLVGFSHLRTFRLVEPVGSYPIKVLQSVEDPAVTFSCLNAVAIQPEYEVPLSEEDALALALEAPQDALVLVIVVIPEDPRHATANLAGPLVINLKTRKGRQVALNPENYPLQFPIFRER